MTLDDRILATRLRVMRRAHGPSSRRALGPGLALAWPTWGCGRLAAHLVRDGHERVAPSTVQRILRRKVKGIARGDTPPRLTVRFRRGGRRELQCLPTRGRRPPSPATGS